jgi:replication factor A1
MKHDNEPYYRACTNGDCKRKVLETMEGAYRCEKCDRTMESCNYR